MSLFGFKNYLHPGVTSRGDSERLRPFAKIFDHLGGLSPPRKSCIGLAFQSLLTLLPKYFLLLCSIMHCYLVIETFLIVDYTISVLN